MTTLAVETSTSLAQQARQGDMKAGRRLIEVCRQGMLVPYWENREKITDKIIEEHLKRRVKVMAGRSFS